MQNEWRMLLNDVIGFPKKSRKWDIEGKITADRIFLESLGEHGKNFERRIARLSMFPSWQTETKGSVHNYHSYFPSNEKLEKWSELMHVN